MRSAAKCDKTASGIATMGLLIVVAIEAPIKACAVAVIGKKKAEPGSANDKFTPQN